MNALSLETSPYLLQHASNPVYWKAWNSAALAEAKGKNQLIIISIGYSACHWCHVMEHESFEDIEVAQTMNSHFVSIKIDREERPDLDAVYMKAVQIMTGSGGWPLNVVALPDGRPIWGGTFFRKEEWIDTLQQLQQLYKNNPEKMLEYAERLHQGIEGLNVIESKTVSTTFNNQILDDLVEKWTKSFDLEFGGMARAPKFMMPNNYQFLMRFGYQTKNAALLDFVNLTLTKMAYGGLFDTIGGGFSRYSVDMKWHVPHFEKMLYDNGQLVSLYADAYKLTKNELYKEVVEKTLSFVSSQLSQHEGGFFSALDADSLDSENKLKEGAFYVWSKAELENLLQTDFGLFAQVFNINDFGFWEENHFVLIQNQSLSLLAEQNNLSLADLIQKKKAWERLLFNARENRKKPRLDDKCLTSWNAIMNKGFVDAYKALQEEKYLELAIQNGHFVLNKLWSTEGHLMHSYKNGIASINGYLDDYSFIVDSFIALYEVTFDESWLQHAKELTNYCLDHFYDEKQGFFSFTSNLDAPLIARHFEIEDNVIPASNSVMAVNLIKLSSYFQIAHYEKIATEMTLKIMPTIDYPSGFSNWMNAYLYLSEQRKELAILGNYALDFSKKIHSNYHPNLIMAGSTKSSNLTFLKDRFHENKLQFYLCQNKTCLLPTSDFEVVLKNIF